MKLSRLLLILSLVLLLAAACAACTSEGPETPTDAASGTSADTEAAGTAADTAPASEAVTAAPTAAPATDAATDAPETPTEAGTDAATEAATAAPVTVPTVKTKTVFADFTGKSGTPEINGGDGWDFEETPCTREFKDGKLVVSGFTSRLVLTRLALSLDQLNVCNAAIGSADAVGFWIENNSSETIGACWFGEIKRADMPDNEHQTKYLSTWFRDIDCWLIDENGKVTKGSEYWHNDANFQDHGLCEIPAHFKGYYVVSLKTLGHDQCIYAAWGDHSASDCHNGEWIDGSTITNIGYSLLNCNPDADANYVIGEYILVDFE